MFLAITHFELYLGQCRRGLRVQVRLGSPRSVNCHGLGICGLEPARPPGPLASEATVTGYIRLDEPTGRLLIHFDNDSIGERNRQRHFPSTGFTVTHPLPLPDWVVDELELSQGTHRIEAGNYPILDDGTFSTISVRIVKMANHQIPLRLAA